MADLSPHHGTRVFESADKAVQIRTADSAVIFLIGTAEDADAAVFPLNTPILIAGASNYGLAKDLGDAGTLKRDLDAIFDQGQRERLGAYVWVTRVAEGASQAETISNLVGDSAALTGVHAAFKTANEFNNLYKPRILIAPGNSAPLSTDGLLPATITVQGTGYTAVPNVTVTPEAGNTPTVPAQALAVLGEGADIDKVVAVVFPQPGEGYTSATTGPTITIDPPTSGTQATGTVAIGAVGNPVVHEMEGIAEKLRAVIFCDGPNTDDASAIAAVSKYGTERVYMIDPNIHVYDTVLDAYVNRPASAHFAGVQVRVDRDTGFHKSVSNERIYGIDGVSRPINYGAQTNLLNFNQVVTITSFGDGFRTWGNRTAADVFLAVRRTKDFVNEAIEREYLKFVDRPMNDANLKFLVEAGKAFLRTLEGNGFILRGSSDVWLDPELNHQAR